MNIRLNPVYLGNFCNNSLTRKVRPVWDTPGVNQRGCGKPFPRNIIYKWLIFHIELLVYPRLIGGVLSHVPVIPSYPFLDGMFHYSIHPDSSTQLSTAVAETSKAGASARSGPTNAPPGATGRGHWGPPEWRRDLLDLDGVERMYGEYINGKNVGSMNINSIPQCTIWICQYWYFQWFNEYQWSMNE